MTHIVLLGDSIFDNAPYVPGHPPVVDQLNTLLSAAGPGDKATLLAVDGDVTRDVAPQMENLPDDATHLVISVGGNDALRSSHVLAAPEAQLLDGLLSAHQKFVDDYDAMMTVVLASELPTAICTIYDCVPGLEPEAVMALSIFNDVIIRAAINHRLPLIDLRSVCRQAEDYSQMSPIEPSHIGGAKIAERIAQVVQGHDFTAGQMVGYR